MIKNFLITTIVVIWLYFSFIIYCALAIKKPTPHVDSLRAISPKAIQIIR